MYSIPFTIAPCGFSWNGPKIPRRAQRRVHAYATPSPHRSIISRSTDYFSAIVSTPLWKAAKCPSPRTRVSAAKAFLRYFARQKSPWNDSPSRKKRSPSPRDLISSSTCKQKEKEVAMQTFYCIQHASAICRLLVSLRGSIEFCQTWCIL